MQGRSRSQCRAHRLRLRLFQRIEIPIGSLLEQNIWARLLTVPIFLLAGLWLAASVAVDGALLVAGGAVLFLSGDGGEVGDVIFGGHGYGAEEETGEGGVAVEDVGALGVDIEEVECGLFV